MRKTVCFMDVNCKAHELDNLYVVDTSFFPSISAVSSLDGNCQRATCRRSPVGTHEVKEDLMQNVTSTTPRRPIGVTIISILLGLQAIVQIIFGLLVFFTTTALSVWAGLFVGWIPLEVGILLFVLAYGLWTLKSWAYWTTLILEVLNILFNLFQFGQPNHSIFGVLSGGLLSIIIVIYMLVDRNVREAFRF
jgi:hypothetical protein